MEFLNDNTDNRNNGKNKRNCGCHEVTYNTDNGITSATEKLLLLSLLLLLILLLLLSSNVRGDSLKGLGISMQNSCL